METGRIIEIPFTGEIKYGIHFIYKNNFYRLVDSLGDLSEWFKTPPKFNINKSIEFVTENKDKLSILVFEFLTEGWQLSYHNPDNNGCEESSEIEQIPVNVFDWPFIIDNNLLNKTICTNIHGDEYYNIETAHIIYDNVECIDTISKENNSEILYTESEVQTLVLKAMNWCENRLSFNNDIIIKRKFEWFNDNKK